MVGILIGASGFYIGREAIPAREAKIITYRQQQDSLAEQGIAAATFTSDTVTIDGEMFEADENTTVQVGMTIVSVDGRKTDLKEHFKPGDDIDLLFEGNQILAIHRELRPDGS